MAYLSRLSQFPTPVNGTIYPSCVDVSDVNEALCDKTKTKTRVIAVSFMHKRNPTKILEVRYCASPAGNPLSRYMLILTANYRYLRWNVLPN